MEPLLDAGAKGAGSPTEAAQGAAGVDFMDAPVSGGEVGAIAGTLSIMAGGSDAAFARAKPAFECMGKNIVHVGACGAGQVAKAANQILTGMGVLAVAEAFAFAAKNEVDRSKVREALLGGFASSRILENHGQRMLDRNSILLVDFIKQQVAATMNLHDAVIQSAAVRAKPIFRHPPNADGALARAVGRSGEEFPARRNKTRGGEIIRTQLGDRRATAAQRGQPGALCLDGDAGNFALAVDQE